MKESTTLSTFNTKPINFCGIYSINQKSLVKKIMSNFKFASVSFEREIDPDAINLLSDKEDIAQFKKGKKLEDVQMRFFEPNVFIVHHVKELFSNPDNFRSFCKEIDLAVRCARGQWKVPTPPYDDYIIGSMREVLDEFSDAKRLSVDIETFGLDPRKGKIVTLGLSDGPGRAGAFDYIHLTKKEKYLLDDFLRDKECGFHNGQYDVPWLMMDGIIPNYTWDTMFKSYVQDERKGVHGLKYLAYEWMGDYGIDVKKMKQSWDDSPYAVMKYNAADCDGTMHVLRSLEESEDEKDKFVHDKILMPAAHHFISLYMEGLRCSKDQLALLKKRWDNQIKEFDEKLYKFCGEEINLASVPQVKKILFDKLKLKKMSPRSGKMSQELIQMRIDEATPIASKEAIECWKSTPATTTKNMTPESTSLFMLHWLGLQHEFPNILSKRRLIEKRIGAYHDGILERLWNDEFLSSTYKLIGTRTGRLSSSDPNLHGTPKDDDIKDIFIAREGFTLIAADYSQAEVRMLAHLAQDENLRIACVDGDIHENNMKSMFELSPEAIAALSHEQLKFYRRAAKTITFGIIYGRGAQSIALQLQVTVEEAQGLIDKFFAANPNVLQFINEQKERTWKHGYAESIYGRRRRFPFIKDQSYKEKIGRMGVNMVIQSSVSDMCLLAYMRITDRIRAEGTPVYIGPHIHDGFWFEVPEWYKSRAIEITKHEMMKNIGFETNVFFKADIEYGQSWGKLHAVV